MDFADLAKLAHPSSASKSARTPRCCSGGSLRSGTTASKASATAAEQKPADARFNARMAAQVASIGALVRDHDEVDEQREAARKRLRQLSRTIGGSPRSLVAEERDAQKARYQARLRRHVDHLLVLERERSMTML